MPLLTSNIVRIQSRARLLAEAARAKSIPFTLCALYQTKPRMQRKGYCACQPGYMLGKVMPKSPLPLLLIVVLVHALVFTARTITLPIALAPVHHIRDPSTDPLVGN